MYWYAIYEIQIDKLRGSIVDVNEKELNRPLESCYARYFRFSSVTILALTNTIYILSFSFML